MRTRASNEGKDRATTRMMMRAGCTDGDEQGAPTTTKRCHPDDNEGS